MPLWIPGRIGGRRHARLAGVQELPQAIRFAATSRSAVSSTIHGLFPTELKRNGSDELRSGFHDQLADRYAARKENIIKLLLQKVLLDSRPPSTTST